MKILSLFLFILVSISATWAEYNNRTLNFDRPFTSTTSNPNRCFGIFKVRPSLLSADAAFDVLGYGRDSERLRRALNYLHENRGAGQYRIVATWEFLALRIIRGSGEGWNAVRFWGPQGEVGYIGSVGHAVVFTADAKILTGVLLVRNFRIGENGENLWNGRGDLQEFQPK